MLIMDNGVLPSAENIMNSEGETSREIAGIIKDAGLEPLQTFVTSLGIPMLRQKILQNGPAIVSILPNPESATGHAIIVDEISSDYSRVRLRDPWHGWDLVAKASAFDRVWKNAVKRAPQDVIVQVKKS